MQTSVLSDQSHAHLQSPVKNSPSATGPAAKKPAGRKVSLRDLIAREIEADDFELPVFNSVAMRIQELIQTEDLCVQNLESLILEDPSLASGILKVANSSFYKGLGDISTIKDATMRLGLEQVSNIVMLLSQKNCYKTSNKQIRVYMDRLWQHSYATAVGCRWIAKICGGNLCIAFLSGLLHDIGKLVILMALERIKAKYAKFPITEESMSNILDSNLPKESGLMLVNLWNLPEPFDVVVQGCPEKAPPEYRSLICSISLMDVVCENLDLQIGEKTHQPAAASIEAQELGLSDIQMAELEIHLEDTLTNVVV